MTGRELIIQLVPPVLIKFYLKLKIFTRIAPGDNLLSGYYHSWDESVAAVSKYDSYNIRENAGWNHTNVVSTEAEKFDQFKKNCLPPGPLGFSHEFQDQTETRNLSFHNIHCTFGYVIGLVSQKKATISVLDYGGGLGHYYYLAKALYPDLIIQYTCKEMPALKKYGERIAPEIEWYDDDSCLNKKYDLVMVNGSLQYFPEWKDTLSKIIDSVGRYFFLTRIPVVNEEGYYTLQYVYGTRMIYQQVNQKELLGFIDSKSLQLIREFIIGDKPYIANAPEQCELKGWLFIREERT